MPPYLKYILQRSIEQRAAFIELVVMVVLTTAARLAEPFLYLVTVDTLADGLVARQFLPEQLHVLVIAIAIWFVLSIFVNLTNAQHQYLTWNIGNNSSQVVHVTGYRRLLQLDYAEHTSQHSSKLVKIVDDGDVSTWEVSTWWLGRIMAAALGFLGMLVIAFSVNWQMTLIALAVVPPRLWFIARYLKRYEADQHKVSKMWEQKHERLSDQIMNIATYKLNPYEDRYVAEQKPFSDRPTAAQQALNKKWRLAVALNPDMFARFMVLGAGVYFVSQGSMTLGTLFMFMGLLGEILIPLAVLSDILPEYSRRTRQINRFITFMQQTDSIVQSQNPIPVTKLQGRVELQNVSFWYSKQSQKSFALHNVSLAIEPGQTVALVGHSGSGKTTLQMLLNRLIDPQEGAILIDGVDLRNYDVESLKQHIGTVLQENAMYNESVARNIAYGKPDADEAAIIEAAKRANAHDFITKLPRGYETIIGERGVRLSGGEKQRIAITRAILKNPTIVILDEPTSALDSLTEQKVQAGLQELAKGRTTLIIAHRLSTVRHANKIIVLERGSIIGQGSHDELMQNCPTYRQMVDLQVSGFLADD